MDRIQHPTAVETRPSYEILPNSKKGYATGFNPVTKSKGTENLASQYNAIQETLMHTIETANLTGDHNDDSLLTQAIQSFTSKKGYIEDSMYYGGTDSIEFVENTIVWKGECRSSDNSLNLISNDYIRSSLISSPIINGTFFGFIGYNNEGSLKFEFTPNIDGTSLPTIIGPTRKVISIRLNGRGGFFDEMYISKGPILKHLYKDSITYAISYSTTLTPVDISVPEVMCEAILAHVTNNSSNGSYNTLYYKSDLLNDSKSFGGIKNIGSNTVVGGAINDVVLSNSILYLKSTQNECRTVLETIGFIEYR